MSQAAEGQDVDEFLSFYRTYYADDIARLAQKYPKEQRSLYLEYDDLYTYDPDLAERYLNRPGQMQDVAEEALRTYDLPVDISLGQAHVRLRNLPRESTLDIRGIRVSDDHIGSMVAVQGIVRKATDVRPKIVEAAFECQRCGTMTYIPQNDSGFQEPHECQGCERQGPFRVNNKESKFIDSQQLRVQESPEGLRGGETPQSIDVNLEDDVCGNVTPGDHVTVVGRLEMEQVTSGQEKTTVFDPYMEGVSVVIEDEEFEDMDITDEDKQEILELSTHDDIYEEMVASVAPSIYGYDQEKLSMILQLFSGVTKHLPDGSRIRGDLHMLLIGDPGTGKCVDGDTRVTLADGRDVPIRELVESNLDDPKPVDDGVWDDADFSVPSLRPNGDIEPRQATKVWKREAPEEMLRIRTNSGRELEVTPSHPLFVRGAGGPHAVRADELSVGTPVAAAAAAATDGGAASTRAVPSASVVAWDAIESLERVEPAEEWVYDLEVEGTHSYVSNGLVSHNSQMLSYIRNIAPRSVYTSGKGSSSAGLCVTGDTLIHTEDGLREVRDLATTEHPIPVSEETSATKRVGLQTFDRDAGTMVNRESSHVWRMPEKPCRRIETAHGKSLTASENTPVLTCGANGLEWVAVSDIEPGQHVAVPRYRDLDRSEVSVRSFLELTTEKVDLADESVELLRNALCDRFGHLRAAAAALDLSEDFIYDSLRNRHVPLAKLDRILDSVELTREDVAFDRLMIRHGDSITLPETFDQDLMYLLGLVFGDGDISLDRRGGNRGMVRISNGNEALLERARDIFAAKFDKRPEIERQEGRVPSIRVGSATIARLFANAGMQTPKADLELAPELTTAAHADAFLRGLMDADGAVSVRENGGSSVLISTISERLAEQIQLMLETYNIRARRRERDRRGTYELDNGHTIESKHVQHFVELYGANIERYADAIGFEVDEKAAALDQITGDATRREETIPVGSALVATDGAGGAYHTNVTHGDNPGRGRARQILDNVDLGEAESAVREAVDADLRWDRVTDVTDVGEQEVFDLTVPETHNFAGNGLVTHNTAAAVRDDFGDGQQWTLEAGALVLADKGIAAVDELDKMRCVTGDTLVHLGDGQIRRIGEIAKEAAEDGSVEPLSNGRTIRDVGLDAWTMTDDGQIVQRSVTAVHEYEAPSSLTKVTLENGDQLTSTEDHPFFIREDGERVERAASKLTKGDCAYVPRSVPPTASDGGVIADNRQADLTGCDVLCRRIKRVESVATDEVFPDEDGHVYDLTVEGTHNFIANGMVVHNSEDRSAMHEALEQQQISVSKAGINATLKSRCSLLGAANPKYGRFDQYEPIGEQIDLEPALISRFDLIFTVTDSPDPDHDAKLADHILTTNYAGELNTQREQMSTSNFTQEQVDEVTQEVAPVIDAELLRKYIAYSKRNCFPTMTDEARAAIRDFYVDLRAKGADEDAPVPVTARKLEALVRLSEASARVRLSDTVEEEDATRVIEIVRSCLQDIGVDPETGQFDADVVETGQSKTQRDRIKGIKDLIETIAQEYEDEPGAPVDAILERADEAGMDAGKAEQQLEKLRTRGEIYEPQQGFVRTT
ncbi:LAGLIDADG family homing endonuclease [Halobaculum limi]|uniref:LAGLIDADG family homing endonuclease n=1 Tax=Halobaculum limi TaxID=3031916 RepID=UPI002405CF07|nr:LAGLIDADG family homing endonuclease [Halobaculum sp. YSMS11]